VGNEDRCAQSGRHRQRHCRRIFAEMTQVAVLIELSANYLPESG
jgi:hypothetical protein